MYKLLLTPESSGYTVKDGKEVVAVQLDGGAARYRRDIVGATSYVTCRWVLNAEDYQYMRAFYRTAASKGADPFTIDLILDDAELVEYEAHFVPETMQLAEQRGLSYVVTADLEVKPVEMDAATDLGILLFFGTEISTTEDAEELLALLEQLVNVELPAATV